MCEVTCGWLVGFACWFVWLRVRGADYALSCVTCLYMVLRGAWLCVCVCLYVCIYDGSCGWLSICVVVCVWLFVWLLFCLHGVGLFMCGFGGAHDCVYGCSCVWLCVLLCACVCVCVCLLVCLCVWLCADRCQRHMRTLCFLHTPNAL